MRLLSGRAGGDRGVHRRGKDQPPKGKLGPLASISFASGRSLGQTSSLLVCKKRCLHQLWASTSQSPEMFCRLLSLWKQVTGRDAKYQLSSLSDNPTLSCLKYIWCCPGTTQLFVRFHSGPSPDLCWSDLERLPKTLLIISFRCGLNIMVFGSNPFTVLFPDPWVLGTECYLTLSPHGS